LITNQDYLEKIIQQTIPLPPVERIHLDNFLKTQREALFKELDISNEEINAFYNTYNEFAELKIKNVFRNLRDVKRYILSLRASLPPIKHEINLFDFCILEIIKVFFRNIYDDMWENKWAYINFDAFAPEIVASPIFMELNNRTREEKKKANIKDLLKDNPRSEIISNLIEALNNGQHPNKRLISPDYYKKYFMLKIPELEIADQYFADTLKSWHSLWEKMNGNESSIEKEISKDLNEMIAENKITSFLDKLIPMLNKFWPEISPSLIRSLYKKAREIIKQEKKDISRQHLFRTILILLSDKVDMHRRNNLIEEIIMYSSPTPLIITIIKCCDSFDEDFKIEFPNFSEGIDLRKLKEKLHERLKEYYINDKRDIFDDLNEGDWDYILWYWGKYLKDNVREKIIFSNYVTSIISNNPKTFLSFIIKQNDQSYATWHFNIKKLAEIYNIGEIFQIAKKHYNSEQLSSKEKEIINAFIKQSDSYINEINRK